MNDPKTTKLKSPVPKRPVRWGRVALIVSLALNLAVAGVVGGAILGRGGPARNDLIARDVSFGFFNDAFSEKDRKELRRAYADANPNIRADRQQMRDDLQTILAALRAEPFDADALRAALETGATRIEMRQTQGQALVLEHLTKMSGVDRAEVANRLENALKRGPRGPKPPPQ
ncbi:periplasmic heavy metal sensor [Pseudorhodobacter sp. W20_MBD10_FR17]|uniref:periplasmic heavy metal sensor n=1 Tax=Pseudorhodobacter sp. W20_MBD10_FR17 TaxID=3240266 RepID=UPI003F963297